jgi:hypothetical protein
MTGHSQGENRANNEGDTNKYGELLLKHPLERDWFGEYISFEGEKNFNSTVSVIYLLVRNTSPTGDLTHSHDFDEYLSFIGLNPDNPEELGAEVEISLGEEQEKHTFKTTTSIYIPKGLPHLPLVFKNVDRPFLLVHIFNTPEYTRNE